MIGKGTEGNFRGTTPLEIPVHRYAVELRGFEPLTPTLPV
jgi:hypothetical protein